VTGVQTCALPISERFVICFFVIHIPAKDLDKLVKKVPAELGFVVGGVFVAFYLIVEIVNQRL
jgi:hypothetical protein